METLTIRRVNELQASERAAITALLDRSPWASAYQYPYVGGDGDCFLLLECDGQLRFCGRASSGYFASRYLPFLRVLAFNRGPVALTLEDFAQGLRSVQQWARSQRYAALYLVTELEWCWRDDLDRALQPTTMFAHASKKRYTLRLDITPTEAELMQGLPSSTRYKIRRALKEGITLRYGTTNADLETFLRLHAEMAGRKGIAHVSRDFLQSLWRLRDDAPDRLVLVMAEHQGSLLGANLIFRSGRRAEYLFGAVGKSNPVLHGDVTAGYPLQWSGIQWAKAAGCSEYDFGGFSPGMDGGPARLKRSFFQTVQPVELCPPGSLDLMPLLPGLIRRLHGIVGRIRRGK